MIQVVPTTAPDDPGRRRSSSGQAKAPDWKAKYGVDVAVTGMTAIGLDITSRSPARCCRSASSSSACRCSC